MGAELRPKSAALATHHPEGASAAAKILAKGGNAIDAAVAAMLTLCVVLPGSVGIGGYGGSMVVYLAKRRKIVAIDSDSRAPLAFRPELYKDALTAEYGYLSTSVPAVIAGMDRALRDYGTMSWASISEHAIALAENGFPVDEYTRGVLEGFAKRTDPLSMRALFKSGAIPKVGDLWVQKDLAAMLRDMADHGPESFYKGDIARRIVAQIHDHGGILTEKDFADYEATIVEPLTINYRGYDLFTPPPPSGGIMTFQILKTLQQFDIEK